MTYKNLSFMKVIIIQQSFFYVTCNAFNGKIVLEDHEGKVK